MRNFFRKWLGIEELHTELFEQLPGVRNEVAALFANLEDVSKSIGKLDVAMFGGTVGGKRELGLIDHAREVASSSEVRTDNRIDSLAVRWNLALKEKSDRIETLEASIAALRREVLGRLDMVEMCVASAVICGETVPIDKKRNGVLTPKKKPVKKKPTRK